MTCAMMGGMRGRTCWAVTVRPDGGGVPTVLAVMAWTEDGARSQALRRAGMIWPRAPRFHVDRIHATRAKPPRGLDRM